MNETKTKVTIPKEIAVVLDDLLQESRWGASTNETLISWVIRPLPQVSERRKTVQEWGKSNFDLLVRALYNGYEYEKTPEDEIREMFQNHPSSSFRLGVKMTLNRLGKRIEGINQ